MSPRDAIALIRRPAGKSAAMFLCGLMMITCSVLVVLRGQLTRSTHAAATYLSADVSALREEARALSAQKQAADDQAPLSSVPAFIDRIGDLADEHGVRIGSIQPATEEIALFELALTAGYQELLMFVAALEELDIQLAGFKLERAAPGQSKPLVEATIIIRPQNDARRLAVPRLAHVRQALGQSSSRDPFQALVAEGASGGGDRLDLTQAYSLTGIAMFEPAGDRIATINLLDYVVGDVLDGRTVVHVGTDRVLLDAIDTEDQQRFVIRLKTPGPQDEFGRSLPSDGTLNATDNR